jgi:hypothetical protein
MSLGETMRIHCAIFGLVLIPSWRRQSVTASFIKRSIAKCGTLTLDCRVAD